MEVSWLLKTGITWAFLCIVAILTLCVASFGVEVVRDALNLTSAIHYRNANIQLRLENENLQLRLDQSRACRKP